jgi:hypothetical protein
VLPQARVMVEPNGRPCNLQGRANGAVVMVIVDTDVGELAFSINDGPLLPALVGLPRERLRPVVGLHRVGDQVTLLGQGLGKKVGHQLKERRKRHEQKLLRTRRNQVRV